MSTRNGNGGLDRTTIIPFGSMFATFDGRNAPCVFTADHDDFELTNGQRVPKGTQILGTHVFVQGALTTLPLNPTTLPPTTQPTTSHGPLSVATIVFSVFCAGAARDLASRIFIMVPLLDPFLNPRPQLDTLRNTLQLDRPQIFTNPVVDRYGGLITRYPTWLAIHPDAWRTQQSPTRIYRGVALTLIAQPRELTFELDFVPNPTKPSPAAHLTIDCIPSHDATPDANALPAFPKLPDQTEPGPNGDCEWTPPGPGTLTITAHITYTITFWANGYTEPDADYIWDSNPTSYPTGELIAVNTKP